MKQHLQEEKVHTKIIQLKYMQGGTQFYTGKIARTKGARITGVRTKMKHPV